MTNTYGRVTGISALVVKYLARIMQFLVVLAVLGVGWRTLTVESSLTQMFGLVLLVVFSIVAILFLFIGQLVAGWMNDYLEEG